MSRRAIGMVVGLLVSTAASAALVTSSSSFPPGSQVVDFSQFTGAGEVNGTNGPVQVGGLVGVDVEFTCTNSAGYLENTSWGFGTNGSWDSGRSGFAGVNGTGFPMVFTFAAPIAAVGGFMNYDPGYGSVTIEALGAGSTVLESYDLTSAAPISVTGNDNGAFRGIVRQNRDIVAFRVTGAFAGVDDLAIGAGALIPTLSLAGLAVLATLLAAAGVAVLLLRGE